MDTASLPDPKLTIKKKWKSFDINLAIPIPIFSIGLFVVLFWLGLPPFQSKRVTERRESPVATELPPDLNVWGWIGISPEAVPGRGILVKKADSTAALASIHVGDLILAIDGNEVRTLTEAESALRQTGPQAKLRIQTKEGGLEERTIVLDRPEPGIRSRALSPLPMP